MEHVEYLPNVIILLSAAVFIVVVFKHLNLSPVLGYLVAGAAIGEHGLAYVNSEDLKVVAEFGVVFLLFAIGLELTIERLMAMRWHVFGFGGAQVVVTAFIFGYIAYQFFGIPIEGSVIIGGSLALSSTAIVLRVLADSNAKTSQVGRLALANLLLQDIAVVPLLVLVPLLSNQDGDVIRAVSIAIGEAFLAMIIIFFLGRMLLRPLFQLIVSAKSNELFMATTLLVVLGVSFATESMNLSLAMGAIIAGLLVAETQYQHQVEDNIMPFKDLLMGLFFMTVGMTIDLYMIFENLPLIIAISLGIMVIKALIIIGLSKVFRFPWGSSIHAGLLMSQGGEFAFVVFGIAAAQGGVITSEISQILLLVVTVTMALTPSLSMVGEAIARRFEAAKEAEEGEDLAPNDISDLNKHVVIAGFGRTGRMVAKLLSNKNVSYIVVDADAKKVRKGKAEGHPVYHGDLIKKEMLETVKADRAKAIIITVPDNVYLKKAVRVINKNYPDIPVVVRSDDLRNEKALKTIGVTTMVPEKFESGLQLAGALLKTIGVSEFEISQLKNQFRAGDYEMAKEIVSSSKS